MDKKRVKEFRRGSYVIRHERWTMEGEPPRDATFMKSAYSIQDGSYIGSTKIAHRLWKKYGIEKFYSRGPGKVTCIGYNPTTKTWYGWSHRAIFGFRKGQKKPRKCLPNEGREYVIANPKRAAAAFAASVS